MRISAALLRNSLLKAETRAFAVFTKCREQLGAKQSGIYALGRYEGLKAAARLLKAQRYDPGTAAFVGPPLPATPSLIVYTPFVGSFKKLHPINGHKAIGR